MRKSDACPKCGADKDVRARQCKTCRKIEQQATKKQTRDNRYDRCECGRKKDKRASQCRKCHVKVVSNTANTVVVGKKRKKECPECSGLMGPKSKLCRSCHYKLGSPLSDGKIQCTACEKLKPIQEFYKRKEVRHNRRTHCKECSSLFERRRHIRRKCVGLKIPDPEIKRIAELKEIACKICGDIVEKFHIDHCHESGKFRDLLCSNCNSGLGLFHDNPNSLRKAAEYIEHHLSN